MRISFLLGVIALAIPANAFALDPDLNARLAPGADGQRVHLSTSVRIPQVGENQAGGTTLNRKPGPLVLVRYYIPTPAGSPCSPQNFVANNPGDYSYIGPDVQEGSMREEDLRNRITGEIVRSVVYCSDLNTPTPSPISIPPSYEDIWQAVYSEAFLDSASASGAYIAPAAPGLTGLPTKVWANFEGGQTIVRDVVLPGGYRVQASAYIEDVVISTTTPQGRRTQIAQLHNNPGNLAGGSFEQPAGEFVFRYKGVHVVSTEIIWTANSATLSGPDIGTITVALGSVRLEINRDYPVNELRPAITK